MKIEDLKNLLLLKIEEIKENNKSEEYAKLNKIMNILVDEPGVFFKISINKAYQILKEFIPENKIEEVYKLLISPENYIYMKENFYI